MDEEIKGCPFCGSDEVEICRTNENACWVQCAECGADAESAPKREQALANWNRRANTQIAIVVDDQDEDGWG